MKHLKFTDLELICIAIVDHSP